MLEILFSFAISLLIGLLIGIEREHRHPEGIQFVGVRTFTLFSVLGTLVATLNQNAITLTASAFVFSIILLNYFRSTANLTKKADVGIVTEVSAAIIFCLGYMVTIAPLVAITISAIVLLILVERQRLHALARKKFKPHEIETVIILIVFALGILPILPNRAIDPWQLFNPQNFGILIATIAAIQFVGYVSIHLFGEKFGMTLTGFFSGLVSSTAYFATLPILLRDHPAFSLAAITSALLATVAMLVDIMIIILVASPSLFAFIIWPMIAMVLVGIISAILLLHFQKIKKFISLPSSNPLNLLSVVRTSLFIGLMLVLISIAKRFIGTDAIVLISFFGGLFEVHGISLATALLYLGNKLNIDNARLILYVAILASFISKFVLLWVLTPYRFALQASLCLLTVLSSGAVVYWYGF